MANQVGYGRPPMHTRWKKGQSGNPSGRPKGAPNLLKDFLKEMAEVISVTEGGKSRRITKQQALLKQLAGQAIKGNVRASSLLIALSARVIQTAPDPTMQDAVSAADRKIVEDYLEREIVKRLAQHKQDEKP